MFQTNLVRETHGEGLDADAVCTQCHTVNAEGALICRTCGNNLRDQRHERLGEEDLLIGVDTGLKRKIIIRSLGAVAFLMVILVAVFANQVADWMVRVGTSAPPDGRILWQGEDGAVFDTLAAELDGFSVSRAAMRQVTSNTQFALDYQGKYVLVNGREVLGYAVARKKDNLLYVAAQTVNGNELRLKLMQNGIALSLVPNGAGAVIGGTRSVPVGRIRQDQQGVLFIGGRDEMSGDVFTCTAYKLPEG